MLNYKDEGVLAELVAIVDSEENTSRIRKHTTDYQLVNGNQRMHLLDALQEKYPESYNTMTIIDVAISGKIVRKLSRVYAAGVKRQIVDKKTGKVNKPMTELINYVFEDVTNNHPSYNEVMQKANEYYTYHRYVEVFNYIGEDGRVRYKSLPQSLFTAIANKDKTKSDAIIFKVAKKDWLHYEQYIDWNLTVNQLINPEIVGIYTLWTKDYNFSFARIQGLNKADSTIRDEDRETVYKIVITDNDHNPKGENPYNIHPFSAVKQPTDGHYYPYGSELAEMGKEINLMLSNLVSIAEQQGFGQAVLFFDGEVPPSITKSGPTHVINIPNSSGKSDFKFANANPDLRGHLDTILAITRILLTTNDLTTDKVSGELNATQFASAIDRLIADSEVIANIEDQRKQYVSTEQNNLVITLHLLRHLDEIGKIPDDYPKVSTKDLTYDDYKLMLSFNEIKPLTTEKEKAETISFLEEKDFILPHEKHMRFNDKLTEPEAMEFEKKIQEAKSKKEDELLNQEVNSANKRISEDKLEVDPRKEQGRLVENEISERKRFQKDGQRNNKTNSR